MFSISSIKTCQKRGGFSEFTQFWLYQRSRKSREVDELLKIIYPTVELGREFGVKLPEIPDYALDMHTRRGGKMGRGIDYFLEGLKVSPDMGSKYKEEGREFEQYRTS